MKLQPITVALDQTDATLTEKMALLAIAVVESNGDINAIGELQEVGPFQIHPIHNPSKGEINEVLALTLLRQAKTANSSWLGAFMHYNAGHSVKKMNINNIVYGLKAMLATFRLLTLAKNKVTGNLDFATLASYDPIRDPIMQGYLVYPSETTLPSLVTLTEKERIIDFTRVAKLDQCNKLWDEYNSGEDITEVIKINL